MRWRIELLEKIDDDLSIVLLCEGIVHRDNRLIDTVDGCESTRVFFVVLVGVV